jgi:hypothetical protein
MTYSFRLAINLTMTTNSVATTILTSAWNGDVTSIIYPKSTDFKVVGACKRPSTFKRGRR